MKSLFPTLIEYKTLRGVNPRDFVNEAFKIRDYDLTGQRWSKKNFPHGYTSYGSLSELFNLSSSFARLREKIDNEVKLYAKKLDIDLKNYPLRMTNCWINIVPPHCYHAAHVHPLSTISGTYYLQAPPLAGQIKFEDPRLACFMGSAPRRSSVHTNNQRFVSLEPKAGKLVLFESWLRHEVTQNLGRGERISVSFNYHY